MSGPPSRRHVSLCDEVWAATRLKRAVHCGSPSQVQSIRRVKQDINTCIRGVMEVVAMGRRFPHRQAGANMALPISLARSCLEAPAFSLLRKAQPPGPVPRVAGTLRWSGLRGPACMVHHTASSLPGCPTPRSSRAPSEWDSLANFAKPVVSVPRPDRAL